MPDEVTKLAEEYAAIEIVYFKHPKVAYDTIGTYETGKAYLSKESAEVLARVALEFCEERGYKKVKVNKRGKLVFDKESSD